MTIQRKRVLIYLCNDGVWRQRCACHIEEHGPYAPANAIRRESSGICVICDHERMPRDGGTSATVPNPHAL